MIDLFATAYDYLRDALRSLGPFEKSLLRAALIALVIFAIVYAIERFTTRRRSNYRSRSFLHDLTYWFYYRAGIHGLVLVAPVIAILEAPLALVALDPPPRLPPFANEIFILVSSDFLAYWIHRAEHRFKFMWAFHTTHHSQTELTFATIARFHPVEMLYHNILVFIPLRLLGVEPSVLISVFMFNQIWAGLQHTQIPWKLGPFYRIMTTPTFHSFHHSTDPAHHDKNFASLFSFWDYLFGTAVKVESPRPSRFGLNGIQGASLLGTLVTPFRLLHEFYVLPLLGRPVEAPRRESPSGFAAGDPEEPQPDARSSSAGGE